MQQEKWKNKTMIRINLIKAEKAVAAPKKEEKGKKPVPTPFIIGLIVIAAAAYFINQQKAIGKENAALDEINLEKAKYREVEATLNRVNEQTETITNKIALINQLKSHQDAAVAIMDELSKSIPYWVWLTEVSYENQVLQIRGRAVSNNLVADYMENLEKNPYLNNVNLISSTQRKMRNNQFYDFAITAKYVLPAPSPPPKKEGAKKEKK